MCARKGKCAEGLVSELSLLELERGGSRGPGCSSSLGPPSSPYSPDWPGRVILGSSLSPGPMRQDFLCRTSKVHSLKARQSKMGAGVIRETPAFLFFASIHRSAWRNCLENGRRPLERVPLAAKSVRSGPVLALLAAFGTPVSGPIPIFQTVSEGFFCEVRKRSVSSPYRGCIILAYARRLPGGRKVGTR